MNPGYLKRIYWQLTGLTMAAMVVALALISMLAHETFERELVPEMAKKASTVGASMRALVHKATSYGIDYRALFGVEYTFAEVHSENPDFAYMAMTDDRGAILYQYGGAPAGSNEYFASPAVLRSLAPGAAPPEVRLLQTQYMVSMPLGTSESRLGMLHIGIDQNFVQKIMLEVLLDIVVVLVVALFFTLELLHFIAGARLEAGFVAFGDAIERIRSGDFTMRPQAAGKDEVGRVLGLVNEAVGRLNERYQALGNELRTRLRDAKSERGAQLDSAVAAWEALGKRFRFGAADAGEAGDTGALARVRAPLFTFILAEELSRSFLPSYINQLLVPVPWISPQIVIGLPIALFMLIVALGQPFLGAWSERVGRRKAMFTGALLGTVGFAATAFAYNLLDLLLWRSICAVGYGMVFVAAQGYVLDHTGPRNRTQGFALFVGAIMVATICGPSIGGILADNVGYRLSFGVSAVLCALSIFAIRMLPGAEARGNTPRSERPPTLADFGRLLVNRRFMTLSGLAAVPAKIILTAFCFYLVPLYMVFIGSTQSMAGRMLMVYAVMMVLLVPVSARFADSGARRDRLVAVGLCLSGLGGFLLLLSDNFLMVFGVVFLLGVGQALSIAAQGTLVGELCREEIKEFGDGSVYGTYRLLERLGNVIGPLLAGVLVVAYGYQLAFVAISALVLICGVLFAFATGAYRRSVPAPG